MISTLIALLPKIMLAAFVFGFTWFVLRLYYTSRYIHRSEVKPLQESQHIMQNQYAILAERIKHTESLLKETRRKLDQAMTDREQALLQLKEYELNNSGVNTTNEMESWKAGFFQELKQTLAENLANTEEKVTGKDQVNLLRQTLKEFKLELTQKLHSSSNQYHELSNQLQQLIELSKTNLQEAGRPAEINDIVMDDSKITERQFTLAKIKKRS